MDINSVVKVLRSLQGTGNSKNRQQQERMRGFFAALRMTNETVAFQPDLDAVVVGAPVDDGLFDGLGVELLVGGFEREGCDLGVRGEAEGDELAGGELGDPGLVGGGEQAGETEALFEADDAVLSFEGEGAGLADGYERDERHDDVPEVAMRCAVVPVMDGSADREDEVDEQHGQHEEVKQRIVAGVIFVGLRSWHGIPFGTDGEEKGR